MKKTFAAIALLCTLPLAACAEERPVEAEAEGVEAEVGEGVRAVGEEGREAAVGVGEGVEGAAVEAEREVEVEGE